jgi:DNA modification methylase
MDNYIQDLHSQIREIPEEVFAIMGESEKNIFKNYKFFPIGLLEPAHWNYKENDAFMAEQLLNSIKRNGQIVTCQVRLLENGKYEVVDGNHRYISFETLGQKFVIAYDHGVIEIHEAKRIALETNDIAFKANKEKLALMLMELQEKFEESDLNSTLPLQKEELLELLNSVSTDLANKKASDEEDEFDTTPPDSERAVSLRGDLYELNNHRLLCGDSTNPDDVERLMNGKKAMLLHTDPPYNVNYAEFNKKRAGGAGKDWTDEYCSEWEDSMTDEDYKDFIYKFLNLAKKYLDDWAHYYVWHATTYFREFLDVFEKLEIPYDKVPIQWVKQVAPLSWVRYKRKSEPCIYGGKGAVNGQGLGARWFGPNNESNIWNIDRDHNGLYGHPTQKPIALASRAIINSSAIGELVLDMFLGSGTTLIASDRLERVCYGMEYEPKFCDVIVKRFMKHCADNNLECNVKRNGELITMDFFENGQGQKNNDTRE